MPTVHGTAKVQTTALSKVLYVMQTPPLLVAEFDDIPSWAWEIIRSSGGKAISVTYDEGPPVAITAVTVG